MPASLTSSLFRFSTESEAIELASDTEYGLASYFYSRDPGRAFRVSEALEYGMVGAIPGLSPLRWRRSVEVNNPV